MRTLDSLGQVITTDLLIVGGGLAGLTAAIAAKESTPGLDVLVVDKVTTGWGGKANKGGGYISYVVPGERDEFLDFRVRRVGLFLDDQELLQAYADESRPNLERLESWGVHIFRDERDEPKYFRWSPELPWRMALMDQDMTPNMARYARRRGVRVLDHVSIVELLKCEDRVVGGMGFSMLDGTCHIVKARATVLANGAQNWRLMRRWASGRGDGIAAAYRAGAQMRNGEFGNFVGWVFADSKELCNGAENVLYNSKGEHIPRAVGPGLQPDIHSAPTVAWYEEMIGGNGPCFANMAENTVYNVVIPSFLSGTLGERPLASAFWRTARERAASAATSPGAMQEVVPGLIGEQAPIKVDHAMATTVAGLYAIGDTSGSGSGWMAIPSTGFGYALFSGIRCGRAAADSAARGDEPRVDVAHTEALKEVIYAPVERASGTDAMELVRAIQDVMSPVGNSVYQHRDRIEAALVELEGIKARLPELVAGDWHHLSACHEVRAMVMCSELFFRTSLEREESRASYLREDYPEVDDANYLEWIVAEDRDGEMLLSRNRIPFDRYPIKPQDS